MAWLSNEINTEMSMNRKVWDSIIGFVPIQKYPSLPCPYCMSHSLAIDPDSISYRKAPCAETSALITKEARDHFNGVAAVFKRNVFFGVLLGVAAIAASRPVGARLKLTTCAR